MFIKYYDNSALHIITAMILASNKQRQNRLLMTDFNILKSSMVHNSECIVNVF